MSAPSPCTAPTTTTGIPRQSSARDVAFHEAVRTDDALVADRRPGRDHGLGAEMAAVTDRHTAGVARQHSHRERTPNGVVGVDVHARRDRAVRADLEATPRSVEQGVGPPTLRSNANVPKTNAAVVDARLVPKPSRCAASHRSNIPSAKGRLRSNPGAQGLVRRWCRATSCASSAGDRRRSRRRLGDRRSSSRDHAIDVVLRRVRGGNGRVSDCCWKRHALGRSPGA